jgi:D-glycero-alpha-D-manno-heptose-7-phosphate kinase
MIITRTPFRVSFFGGGSDYPAWYNRHGGIVLSTSIDKYCYVICRYLPPFFDYNYRIRYTKREETKTIDEIQHPSVRECLKFLDFSQKGVEIQHNSDLPAMSGLGSSSAFTVGLLHSLYALKGKMIPKRQLAADAIFVEQEKIKESVGSQDQVAAAFGGFNRISFNVRQGFEVSPVVMHDGKLADLQDHLMLFFTGFPRYASVLAAEQIKAIDANEKQLFAMMQLTDSAVSVLSSESDSIDRFGTLLHEGWLLKRSLTSQITNNIIDNAYETARSAGALGGKLLGAGGGGFMLIFARPQDKIRIKEKLKNFLHVPFRFDNLGSQIIFYCHDDYADEATT